MEKQKTDLLAAKNIRGGKAEMKYFREINQAAIELIREERLPAAKRSARYEASKADPLVQFVLKDSIANVLCPGAKLWNTGTGANAMREALSLMGGYGITEDCPGFLAYKWMDAQLEATYEGPEAVQRRNLSVTMTSEVFLAQYQRWVLDMRKIAEHRPGTGACTLATAMQLWLWSYQHLRVATDADGDALYQSARQGVTFPLADALCWLLAARQFILDVIELEEKGPENPVVAEGFAGTLEFFSDLCHIQSARSAGEVGRICAELVFGYNRHPAWDEAGYKGCYHSDEIEQLEGWVPGITAFATDVVSDIDGSHPIKAGPCASCQGLEGFQRLRTKLDGCLTGAQLAKDRAAEAISKVMIPEALDYPR
jgi:Acyl-CoA dehydrogenase, C-terminal domain